MSIKDKIRVIAKKYRENLDTKTSDRIKEMENDDFSHYLIYNVFGIDDEKGKEIDVFQNVGRFVYKYAGSFLEEATKLCFLEAFPDSGSFKIPNTESPKPKTFEIDCLVNNDAIEIKWRDATTDGDHKTKEHTRMIAISKAGYNPVRLMFYHPNRKQAIKIQKQLRDLYNEENGEYYSGDEAWQYVKTRTGIDLFKILNEISVEVTSE